MSRLITYKIQGGNPFTIEVEGNPPIEHEGGVTVAHLYLKPNEIGPIMLAIVEFGVTLEFWDMTTQTESQKREREILAGKRKDMVIPNSKCPECAWFDPLTKNLCGLSDWPQESKEVLLQKSHHKNHSLNCPTPKVWNNTN